MAAEPNRARLWPAPVILALGAIAFLIVRARKEWPYEQARILAMLGVFVSVVLLLLVWWMFFSRVRWRARFIGLAFAMLPLALFRHRGMTGDFIPIFEFRFAQKPRPLAAPAAGTTATAGADFPQLFGPTRDCRLEGPALDPDWKNRPPQVIWRQPVGAAWSGFAIAGGRGVTMEQHGSEEWVTCYDLATGKFLWKSGNPGRYDTAIAGEGPRATPTISDGRVFTLGATGTLRCIDLDSGKERWSRDIAADSGAKIPDFGFASSPLIHADTVIVSAGGTAGKSLLAYGLEDGKPVWTAGSRPVNYSSPFLLTLAGRQQIVMFNSEAITAHDPATGAVLWEHAWGKGMPHVSRPIPTGDRRILFSSGYGVGSALVELTSGVDGTLTTNEVWKTIRFQAKFSNPVEKDG
ncbi:MAG: PQQ-binding-like beta-propeller repeat protein, partial [Chthoniobacteraceae bacterium]